MKVTGYAYPWDVLDAPGFGARAADLEVDEVAVALSYHSARAATPWSADGTSVVARHAAFYRPVREQAWQGSELRPSTPDWVARTDSGGDAVRLLNEAGIPAAAWIVLTHNSQLGTAHPDLAVRNCFGEVYPWALCPARPAVREYAATLTAEAVDGLELSSVVLEACGPLGAVHQHQHEKTDGVWAPGVARLLSVCCCAACAEGWAERGHDAETVREQLRREVRRLIAAGDLTLTEDKLLPSVRRGVLETRQAATDALRRAVLDRLPGGTRIVLHGALDPWVTGALPGLTPAAPADVDSVVLQNWAPGQSSVDAVAAARAKLPEDVAVGSYITAVAASPVPDIEAYVTELGKAGAAELHLYHLGLAGPARWPDLLAATAAAHSLS
ncbi:alpha-amylase family protein [Amycolatopsis samaneae]|uniref:Alanine-rich protein n=1 Tax=Amycolatopsis samaneae TaxID=664691 RepID=A0ABW5GPD3_9PSEU